MQLFVLTLLSLSSFFAHCLESNTRLQIDPHIYSGIRGNEPQQQLVGSVHQNWLGAKWQIYAHAEFESLERRDLSLDLDRFWYQFSLDGKKDTQRLYIGRIHPYNISQNPAAENPFGLLAKNQARTMGLLLGYGYDGLSLEPKPLLMGWLGLHYWGESDNFGWGFSASPFFLPDSGPEIFLSPNSPVSVGRFARRPSETVVINGQTLPIRYELDRSKLFSEVIFQPQWMGTAKIKWNSKNTLWLNVSRSPTPETSFNANSIIRVDANRADVLAIVRPQYLEKWEASLTNAYQFAEIFHLITNVYANSFQNWGWELGIHSKIFNIGLMNEYSPQKVVGAYGEWLLSAGLHFKLGVFELYSGLMTHLTQSDLWARAAIQYPIEKNMTLNFGTDIFTGNEQSYFGEWRTNDRLFMLFQWQVG